MMSVSAIIQGAQAQAQAQAQGHAHLWARQGESRPVQVEWRLQRRRAGAPSSRHVLIMFTRLSARGRP